MDSEKKLSIEESDKWCMVNVECNWSKTMSVCSMLVADLRYVEELPLNKKLVILRTLIKENGDNNADNHYDMPYNKIYAPHLHARDIETHNPKSYKKELNLPFDKVDRVINVRKPSPKPHTSRHSNNVKSIVKQSAPNVPFSAYTSDFVKNFVLIKIGWKRIE